MAPVPFMKGHYMTAWMLCNRSPGFRRALLDGTGRLAFGRVRASGKTRSQGRAGELIFLEFRIELEVLEKILGDQVTVCVLENRADLQPVFLVDIDGQFVDAPFFRRI